MTTPRLRHTHRKRTARIFLVLIFLLLGAGSGALFLYALSDQNPWRLLLGVLIGYSLSFILLLVGIWLRKPWARYVLISVNWLMVALFSLTALILGAKPELNPRKSLILIGGAMFLIVAANVWLIASKRIRYLASVPGSGG